MTLRFPAALAPLALAFALPVPAIAEDVSAPAPAEAAPHGKPQLILAIAVDQLSADLFAQYRQHFTKGFARLLQGAVYPSGYQSHAATETCPGHSTLMTGAHPSRTGIVANNWYMPGLTRAEKKVYCAEDESDPRSSPDKPVVTSAKLKVPTLGDLLKQVDPRTINAAVAGKDRAAVMMSGHNADAAYWWEGKAFATYEKKPLGKAAQDVSADVAKRVAAGEGDLPFPGWCGAFDRAVNVARADGITFSMGTGRFPMKAGDFRGFAGGPRLDAATGDLALRMVDELGMGKDEVPDVLSVSFSATDKVGHAYGNEGLEMCIQLTQLDQTIDTLLAGLDARGIDYVVMLTADHGGIDAPERLDQQGYPGGERMSADLDVDALAEAIGGDTGIKVPEGKLLYGGGGSGDIYLAHGLSPRQRKKLLTALVKRLEAHPQVESVYRSEDLAKLPVPTGNPQDWTMIERTRASFDPERSGDVLMMTKRGVVPISNPAPSFTATHGSPWDYDRRVPMLFWRKGVPGFEQPAPVETVDIAPTLAATVGLTQPAGTWDGRCLDIDGGQADTCAP